MWRTSQTHTLSHFFFKKDIVKGAVLGSIVFGVYDFLVFRQTAQSRGTQVKQTEPTEHVLKRHSTKTIWMQASVSPKTASAPVAFHFAAGAMAGLVQSAILVGWEIVHYWWRHRSDILKTQSLKHVNMHLNLNLVIRRAVHHSVGFATLFGIYETIRRALVNEALYYFASGSPSVPSTLELLEKYRLIHTESKDDHRSGIYDMTIVPMSAAFVAGGFPGTAHFVVGHYTSHWKLMSASAKVAPQRSLPKRRSSPPLPRLRATMGAFLPTALCFLAFQYGGELTERWLDDEDMRRPFPVHIWAPN